MRKMKILKLIPKAKDSQGFAWVVEKGTSEEIVKKAIALYDSIRLSENCSEPFSARGLSKILTMWGIKNCSPSEIFALNQKMCSLETSHLEIEY